MLKGLHKIKCNPGVNYYPLKGGHPLVKVKMGHFKKVGSVFFL